MKNKDLPDSECKCGNCNAFLKQGSALDSQTPNGLCRANPPTPLLVGAQQKQSLVNGPRQVQPVVFGFHPPRNEHEWCRAWQPVEQEEEIVAPNMAAVKFAWGK